MEVFDLMVNMVCLCCRRVTTMRRKDMLAVLPATWFVPLLAIVVAARASGVPVRVTVKGVEQDAPIYVGLVADSDAHYRPTAETVVSHGRAASFDVAPGFYRVVALSAGFEANVRTISVLDDEPVAFALELAAAPMFAGIVRDHKGTPVADARVAQVRAVVPVSRGFFSDLALGLMRSDWSTQTDHQGMWTMSGSARNRVPMVTYADGFSPSEFSVSPMPDGLIEVVLAPGGRLTVQVEGARNDYELLLESAQGQTTAWDSSWWAKPAGRVVKWDSVPHGRYRLVARPADWPFSGGPSVVSELQVGSEPVEASISIPSHSSEEASKTVGYIQGAFVSPAREWEVFSYGKRVDSRAERSPGGTRLLWRSTDEFCYATDDDLLAVPKEQIEGREVIELDHFTRASVSLRLIPTSIDVPLPSSGISHIRGCPDNKQAMYSFGVPRDGTLSIPLPQPCHHVVLQLSPFESFGANYRVAPRETFALGDVPLRLGSSIDLQIVSPNGEQVDRAEVTVSSDSGEVREVVFQGSSGLDGKLQITGLKPDVDLIIEARHRRSQLYGETVTRLGLGEQKIVLINMLPPARLSLQFKISPELRERLGCSVLGAFAYRLGPDDTPGRPLQVQLDASGWGEVDQLDSGEWMVNALVRCGDSTFPLNVERVNLAPGDVRGVDAELSPPMYRGRVVSAGKPLPGRLTITNSRERGGVRRTVTLSPLGEFWAVLSEGGDYYLELQKPSGPKVAIGWRTFEDPSNELVIEVPSGQVTVALFDDHGAPLPGEPVELADERGRVLRRGVTNNIGRVTFESLAPGVWLARWGDIAKELTLISEEHLSVTLVAGENGNP